MNFYSLGTFDSAALLLKGATAVDDHDNIFDEDDAPDYIMYKEMEKEVNSPQAKSGCLGVLLLLMIPASIVRRVCPLFICSFRLL